MQVYNTCVLRKVYKGGTVGSIMSNADMGTPEIHAKDLFGPWFNTLTEAEVKAFVAGQIMATAAHVHVDDVDAQTEVINRYIEVIASE